MQCFVIFIYVLGEKQSSIYLSFPLAISSVFLGDRNDKKFLN